LRYNGVSGQVKSVAVSVQDGANLDSFSRLRVSTPTSLFDAQFTYDLQPLLFEQTVAETGAAIAHDATNRCALFTFANTPTGGTAIMQSYDWFRYQPGKSQAIFATFNFIAGVANVVKFIGYSDGNNGVEFVLDGTTKKIRILSDTTAGDETVSQSSWNLDKLDGTGASALTLDITKTQILVIDLQSLYVGRVRVGFDIGGKIIYAHEFNHANLIAYPYIQTANLPIRAGMTCTGTVSTTMNFICCNVSSEGGVDDTLGYQFTANGTATASNGARTHILSLRPNTTFNSLANRTKFVLESVDIANSGSVPVLWELCLGQAISGTTSFTDVNATYSGFEFNTAGTISGSPTIVIVSGYLPSSATSKQNISTKVPLRYPITLDAAGAVRALGTLSIDVTGIGNTADCRATLNWKEIR